METTSDDPLQSLVDQGRITQLDLWIHRLFVPDVTLDLNHPTCRYCGKALDISSQEVAAGLDNAWEMDTSVKGFECAECTKTKRLEKLRKLLW